MYAPNPEARAGAVKAHPILSIWPRNLKQNKLILCRWPTSYYIGVSKGGSNRNDSDKCGSDKCKPNKYSNVVDCAYKTVLRLKWDPVS